VKLLIVSTLAGTVWALPAVVDAQSCVQVEVQNLKPGEGPLMLAAYTDEASFRKTPAATLQAAVVAPTQQLQVCGLSGAAVALTLFQDLNRNGKLDSNALGMPTEPWGASGKPPVFSAPTWETSRVPLDGSVIVVKLRD
jgi:uncharacterized protein (DUF2141 family)